MLTVEYIDKQLRDIKICNHPEQGPTLEAQTALLKAMREILCMDPEVYFMPSLVKHIHARAREAFEAAMNSEETKP